MIKRTNEKMCSFYVSKNHLVVILMSYLKNNLDEETDLHIFMEDDFQKEINNLIDKMEFKEEIKKKILNKNWKITNRKIDRKLKGIVIVQGSYEYIRKINNQLNKNVKIKLINCYKFEDFESNSREILENHGKIINTLGEQYISTLFDKKTKQNPILTK